MAYRCAQCGRGIWDPGLCDTCATKGKPLMLKSMVLKMEVAHGEVPDFLRQRLFAFVADLERQGFTVQIPYLHLDAKGLHADLSVELPAGHELPRRVITPADVRAWLSRGENPPGSGEPQDPDRGDTDPTTGPGGVDHLPTADVDADVTDPPAPSEE